MEYGIVANDARKQDYERPRGKGADYRRSRRPDRIEASQAGNGPFNAQCYARNWRGELRERSQTWYRA